MIGNNGWSINNIWEHSSIIEKLYEQRCKLEIEEMTSHAQAVDLLMPYLESGDKLLDVGCGSGYFYHSIRSRNIPVEYYGIDATGLLIDIGRKILPLYGLSEDHLQVVRIEDMDADVDHIVCLNVLSNIDNYHRPLERILKSARKTVVLRESIGPNTEYKYVIDKYLDKELKVHVNTYSMQDLKSFIENYGYAVSFVEDIYTKGQPQLVIDHLHYWQFIIATKIK